MEKENFIMHMNLEQIIRIAQGEVITKELSTDVNIHGGCCADLRAMYWHIPVRTPCSSPG